MLSITAAAQIPKDSLNKKNPAVSFVPSSFSGRDFVKPLPENYYYNHIGFFCKQEIQIQKVTKIPLKIRVGNIPDCDKMEGKTF